MNSVVHAGPGVFNSSSLFHPNRAELLRIRLLLVYVSNLFNQYWKCEITQHAFNSLTCSSSHGDDSCDKDAAYDMHRTTHLTKPGYASSQWAAAVVAATS